MSAANEPIHVPEVPEGTILRLPDTDWSLGRGLPIAGYVEVVVVRVRDDLAVFPDRLWVHGHVPECLNARPKDQHPPCVEVLVTVAALRRAVES